MTLRSKDLLSVALISGLQGIPILNSSKAIERLITCSDAAAGHRENFSLALESSLMNVIKNDD